MKDWNIFNKILCIVVCAILVVSTIIMCTFSESLLAIFVASLLCIAFCTIFYNFFGILDCRKRLQDEESKEN